MRRLSKATTTRWIGAATRLLLAGFLGAAAGIGCSGGGADTESSSSSGGGDPVCADNPAQTCTVPYECDGECGPGSLFDAAGCMRPRCTGDAECGAGERCMVPGQWGDTCLSVDFACADQAGACACSGGGGCDGGYCLAEASWPPEQAHQSGPVAVSDTCRPGGGIGTMFILGDTLQPGWIVINIWEPAPLALGVHKTEGAEFCVDAAGETWCASGVVEITSWSNGLVSGSYRSLSIGRIEGAFTDAPYTPQMLMCG